MTKLNEKEINLIHEVFDYSDDLNNGFIQIPHSLLKVILFDKKLTKRQIKIILFIVRMSIGCNLFRANLKPKDFKLLGIHISDITRELKFLMDQNIIGWDREENRMWINYNFPKRSVSILPIEKEETLGKLLNTNLVEHIRTSR